MAPDKRGESVKFEVQKLYKGKWYSALTGGGKLNTQSTAGTYFTLGHADLGYQYRIRAVYEPGSDASNLSADSAWQYYIVEK